MEKWMKALVIGLLALGLVACGDADKDDPEVDAIEPETEEKDNEKAEKKEQEEREKEEEKEKELTIEDVFDKANEASQNIESVAVKMTTDQEVNVPGMQLKAQNKTDMTSEMIKDPITMHQTMEVGMEGNEKMEMEFYLVDNDLYLTQVGTGEWIKMPSNEMEEFEALIQMSEESQVNFEEMKEFMDQFDMKEEGDEYVLHLNAKGDEFKKFMESQLETSGLLGDMDASAVEAFENMEINELQYELFIDKETFHTNAFNMVLDINMVIDGEEASMKQDVQAEMEDINEIDEIVVPEEVVENAIEQ